MARSSSLGGILGQHRPTPLVISFKSEVMTRLYHHSDPIARTFLSLCSIYRDLIGHTWGTIISMAFWVIGTISDCTIAVACSSSSFLYFLDFFFFFFCIFFFLLFGFRWRPLRVSPLGGIGLREGAIERSIV